MDREWGRREFLGAAASAVAVAFGGSLLAACKGPKSTTNPFGGSTTSAGGSSSTGGSSGAGAFQLSTRRQTNACKACQAHAHNRVYATREAANADRAHKGCNCKVAAVPADAATLSQFKDNKTVHDKRWK